MLALNLTEKYCPNQQNKADHKQTEVKMSNQIGVILSFYHSAE